MNHQQQNNRENNSSSDSFCNFHPKQLISTGVCPFCLNERLLVIAAAKQRTGVTINGDGGSTGCTIHSSSRKQNQLQGCYTSLPPSNNNKSKIFALGSLLIRGGGGNGGGGRPQQGNCLYYDDTTPAAVGGDHNDLSTSSSLEEDSFISIRFEENGTVSWDNTTTTEQQHPVNSSKHQEQLLPYKNYYYTNVINNKTLAVDQTRVPMKWHKRVMSQLLHLIQWRSFHKTTSSSSFSSNGVGDRGGEVEKSSGWWIMGLTRRRRGIKRNKQQC